MKRGRGLLVLFILLFGITLVSAIENNFKFTGKELDSESGLYYYGSRYYNPGIGRFTTPDVLKGNLANPLSLNRYAYVENNPLKYVDPSGSEKKKANNLELLRAKVRQVRTSYSIDRLDTISVYQHGPLTVQTSNEFTSIFESDKDGGLFVFDQLSDETLDVATFTDREATRSDLGLIELEGRSTFVEKYKDVELRLGQSGKELTGETALNTRIVYFLNVKDSTVYRYNFKTANSDKMGPTILKSLQELYEKFVEATLKNIEQIEENKNQEEENK